MRLKTKHIFLVVALAAVFAAPATASASSTHYQSLPYGKIVKYMHHLANGVCNEIGACSGDWVECRRTGQRTASCTLEYEMARVGRSSLCTMKYYFFLIHRNLYQKKTPVECVE